MNIIELLEKGSSELKLQNILSHKLDSEILLAKVLKNSREKIIVNSKKEVNLREISEFTKLIKRRSSKEPIAYILKEKEFWSKNFYVNKSTLIPRPETELMVDKIVKIFKKKRISILDIGTGSGCILISLLSELNNSIGLGVDISNKAIKIAKKNAIKHCIIKRTKFLRASFSSIFNQKFDLIVSNPPYIKSNDLKNLECDIKNYEPKIAIDGGNDGLDVIKKVIYKTKHILKIKGMLALEIGNEQYKKVSKILLRNNFKTEYIIKDYKDNIRCILSTYKT